MRYFVSLLILLAVCCIGSCSGKGQGSAVDLPAADKAGPGQRSSSVDEVLAELRAMPVPAGVDAALFGELKTALATVLSADADGKLVSRPPLGTVNRITDLASGISDDGLAGIQWNYLNVGDYDLNGEVNISDLTPIGQHFGKNSESADWKTAARFADGDSNGEVNISDITPIGAYFFNNVTGYKIQSAPGPDGPFSDEDQIFFAEGTQMLTGMRRFHFEVPEGDLVYRVVPTDLIGIPGEPSDPSQEFIISERTRVVGAAGGAQFVGRDGSNVTLTKPTDGSTIEPGDVVVGEEDGGYLIRAVEVIDTGAELEVQGEPGILADVFLQGGLSEALDDISQVPQEVYTLNLAGQILVDDTDNGLRAEITEGTMSFLPQADVAVNYNQYGGVTYLRGLVLGGPLELDMTVLVDADDWDGTFPASPAETAFYEHKMTGFEFDFVAYQNGVPVTMALQYDVYVGIRGSGQLHGLYQAQVRSTYEDIRMGGIFNSAGIVDFNEYTASHGTVPAPGISENGGTFSFTAYVRPEIHIKLYGNPVPGNSEDLALTLSPGMTLEAERTLAFPFGSNYTLEGAMDTSYMLELHHIGLDEDDQFKFFEGLPDLLQSGFIEDFEPPA